MQKEDTGSNEYVTPGRRSDHAENAAIDGVDAISRYSPGIFSLARNLERKQSYFATAASKFPNRFLAGYS